MITANNRWCEVDFLSFESIKVKNIHVLGDAIQIAPAMPKSGHMANSARESVRGGDPRAFAGQPPNPAPVTNNTCYSFITDKDVVHVDVRAPVRPREEDVHHRAGLGRAVADVDAARRRVRVRLGTQHLGRRARLR